MFSSNLRFVPWKNKDEWLLTYENAYSSDIDKQGKACQTMELWLLLRKDVPPGVECTLNILSALQEQNNQAPRQLQLILSTAVLRVVNMLCDNARQSGKETIYAIAKYYNLPDWIVNLRHDVSHGSTLPDLGNLKRAANFLLEWLKEYYWEIEKEELKDLIIKRSRKEMCCDNVQFYLDVYVKLSTILFNEPEALIKNLKDQNLMYSLMDVNKRSGLSCAMDCLPWIRHSKESFANHIPTDQILSMKIPTFLHLMLQQLKDYIIKISFWQFDPIPLIIDAVKDSYLHCESEEFLNKWETMIKMLNQWEVLDKIMVGLLNEKYLNNEGCNIFFTLLCKAVAKRHLYDKLKSELSSSKYISSDSIEQNLIKNFTLKKQLKLPSHANDKEVQKKLFARIEKKNVNLRYSPRLNDSVNYIVDKCVAVKLIKLLALNPNQETINILNILFIIINPSLPDVTKENIKDLILIKLGKKPFSKLNLDHFSIKNVCDVIKHENSSNAVIKNGHKENNWLMETDEEECHIVRSGWDFSSCPLGVTPWELEGSEYYHKPFDPDNPPKNKIFPFYRQQL